MPNCERFKEEAEAITPGIFLLKEGLNKAEADKKEAAERLSIAKQRLDQAIKNLECEIEVIKNLEDIVINGPAQVEAASKSVNEAKTEFENVRREYIKIKVKYQKLKNPNDKMKVDTARLQMKMAEEKYGNAVAALKTAKDRFKNAKNYLENEAAKELLDKVKERNSAQRACEQAEQDLQEAQEKIKDLSMHIKAEEKRFADLMEAYRKCVEEKRVYR